jgi:hypothetical protein
VADPLTPARVSWGRTSTPKIEITKTTMTNLQTDLNHEMFFEVVMIVYIHQQVRPRLMKANLVDRKAPIAR